MRWVCLQYKRTTIILWNKINLIKRRVELMKRQEVVIYAHTYDFKNAEGIVVPAGEIHILSKRQSSSNEKGVSSGHKIAEVEVPFEVVQKLIGQVPAVCDIEYEITVVNKALVLLPKNVHVIKPIESLNILEEKDRLAEETISSF
jgi:hypothetical protein